MMISPSKGGTPVRLLGGPLRGREVTRLEFYPVDWVAEEAIVVDDLGSEVSEVEDEKALAEIRLKAQALEVETRIESARRESRAMAREEWEAELEERVAAEQTRVARVCEEFARERSKYFADVEAEVVRLALAIAARVLHREAKLDPLLLAGVVRVALEKVKEESATVLRVPASEVEMWKGLALSGAMEVMADERMNTGDCAMETSVGKVELGVGAQLKEIEEGFFDLLQQRPS
jgi:flagellar assembly protein FliH